MSNRNQKMKEIIFSKDHLTSYNFVNVCKNSIINCDIDLQNYNATDLPGKIYFNVFTT